MGDSSAKVVLSAKGGRGGNGGNGGRGGGNSAKGKDGKKAWVDKDATNGEDGARGGSGGNGGINGDGGNGSNVTVVVNEEDTDLLMLLRSKIPETHGGKGGSGGKGGYGVPGSLGGKGGERYHFVPMSHRHNHSLIPAPHNRIPDRPGGKDGKNGEPGTTGTGHEFGKDGRDGVLLFTVNCLQESGERKPANFGSVYDVKVRGVEFEDSLQSSVIEPGGKIHLYVEHCNEGGMPTPKYQALDSFVKENEWVSSSSKYQLESSLLPNQSCKNKEPIVVQLNNHRGEVAIGEPFLKTGTLEHSVVGRRVNLEFPTETSTNFSLKYPVQISSFVASSSQVSPGEESLIVACVENISKLPLGSKSEGKRVLQVFLEVSAVEGSDVPIDLNQDVTIYTESGIRAKPLEGVRAEIFELKPNEKTFFVVGLSFNDGVVPHSKISVTCTLLFGNINRPEIPQVIHKRTEIIRVPEYYTHNNEADILLITNDGSTFDEITAWKDLIKSLGLTCKIWNLNLHRSLGLNRIRVEDQSSLQKDWKGKTAVFLLNECVGPDGKISRSMKWTTSGEIFRACRMEKMKFLLFGEDDFHVHKEIIPLYPSNPKVKSFENEEDFWKSVSNSNDLDLVYRIQITVTKLGGTTEVNMEERCTDIRDKLKSKFPKNRFVVAYDYKPESAGFLKNSLGECIVIQSLDDTTTSLLHIKEKDVHSPQKINSIETKMNLIKCLSFEQKLRLLDRQISFSNLQDRTEIYNGTFDSQLSQVILVILTDIYDEQFHFRRSTWNEGVSQESYHSDLLQSIADYKFTSFGNESNPKLRLDSLLGSVLLDLGFHLKIMNKNFSHEVADILLGRRATNVTKSSTSSWDEIVLKQFCSGTQPTNDFLEGLKAKLREKKTEWKKILDPYFNLEKDDYWVNMTGGDQVLRFYHSGGNFMQNTSNSCAFPVPVGGSDSVFPKAPEDQEATLKETPFNLQDPQDRKKRVVDFISDKYEYKRDDPVLEKVCLSEPGKY
eukprot:TRINITY_DN3901_c0_g1_i3.p1 TRINITY_DN3901_c0_g1~~TRINITY_DN3901_c0_g1_i3.p1  ORF type:complete len:1104 (-),score=306.21 TRINITY_DN3901_c0_g1_i3:45-3047(-)